MLRVNRSKLRKISVAIAIALFGAFAFTWTLIAKAENNVIINIVGTAEVYSATNEINWYIGDDKIEVGFNSGLDVNQDKTISFVGSVSDVKTVLSGYVSGNICDDYEMIFAAEDGFKTALKCTSNGETTEFMIDPETNISNDLTGLTLELKKKYIYNIRFNNTASISYDNDEHKYSLKESSALSYLYVSKNNELSFVSCNENDEYCDFTLNSNNIISLTSDSSGLSDGYEWVLTANDGATWKFKQNETRHIDVSEHSSNNSISFTYELCEVSSDDPGQPD